MIGEILLVLVLLGLIRLGKWVFLPYLDWKKNYQARNQEYFCPHRRHIKVTTIDGKSYNAAEYREFVKDRKVELSLVVPSYNEEKRLPVMLKETVEVRSDVISVPQGEEHQLRDNHHQRRLQGQNVTVK